MINLRELILSWGFTSHPFESYTAENEPRLSDYFVEPPYLYDMVGTVSAMTPAIVFGARGIGKSAIRIYIENLCSSENSQKSLGGKSLAVTYDDFSKATESGIDSVNLELHLRAILSKLTATALTVIANELGEGNINSEALSQRYPDLDTHRLGALTRRHFQPLTDFQKEKSLRGTFAFFRGEGLNVSERVTFFQKLWMQARVPIIDIANLVQAVRGKEAISAIAFEMKTDTKEEITSEVLLGDLNSVAAITSQIGYSGWYILIDKVDEDEHTDSDAGKSAMLILPLLKNLRVLETDRLGFKFFLWNQLRTILSEEKIRLDKIRNWEMSWTDAELINMINRRLAAYSSNKVNSLDQIVRDDAGDVYGMIIYYSMSSPREMIHILDSIFREHARHSNSLENNKINRLSIDMGIDDYCLRRVKDIYPTSISRSLVNLPKKTFTSADVQSVLRISKQSASIRINKWADDGHIERIDDTRSNNDPSKTVHQYAFKEKRFERIIERELISENERIFDDESNQSN